MRDVVQLKIGQAANNFFEIGQVAFFATFFSKKMEVKNKLYICNMEQ